MSDLPANPIARNPNIRGGKPIFAGTRVPVRRLFEYLESGENLDDFLQGFPSVSREQALEVLAFSRNTVLAETL